MEYSFEESCIEHHEIDDAQELNYAAITRTIMATGYTGFVGQEFIPIRDHKFSHNTASREKARLAIPRKERRVTLHCLVDRCLIIDTCRPCLSGRYYAAY